MRFIVLLCILFILGASCRPSAQPADKKHTILIKPGILANRISPSWQEALRTRQSPSYIDSLSAISRPLTTSETEWHTLLTSRLETWNSMRDSLAVPFPKATLPDTVYIMPGYGGWDDGFTFQSNTVCFDLSALSNAYGNALDSINKNRFDRLFAHEFTHLLHKKWMADNSIRISTFRDSILWECLYEGMGMYRSMSAKWFPESDTLSESSAMAMKSLYPIFQEKMGLLYSSDTLSQKEKEYIQTNLSRGSMHQKWGALPVAIWLALEARGDDRLLIPWINMGHEAIPVLAEQYLSTKLLH